ncbi:MAG: bacillithiol biosynthesis deacetylase BshB1 [Candidatus Eisenbacteria bacterium]|uniref:Bacillithiol biosynthesis deacetylase BshB1 n=1 Tax=Eiseniibacteriota bacterium TaxID=2212470 RepID=A0A937XB91_UNCEI|nr:bacillithiol biosynthesis deacetylase BshB1 [Candidatus Eisenbacteria bacterium]
MPVDVLAIGAHPDDVDMICGGTLAKLAARGRAVAILDLTRGEMGTRGTPETRAREAQRAAEILGARERVALDLGDGRIENSADARRQVIEVVRRLRPTLILTHYWDDLHPDHAAAGHLVRAVMYPVGFARYPAEGEPYRPNEVLFFMAHTPFEPSFVVDVDGYHERKMEAVRCFASQFHSADSAEPPTGISQPDFLLRLEARARHYGGLIGRAFGEPFLVTRAVPVADPVEHYAPFPKIYSSRSWEDHR